MYCCLPSNVIDVAALDSHNLQQHEYMERVKMYNVKVQQALASNRNTLANKLKSCILQDVPQPEKVLGADLLSLDDTNLVIIEFVNSKCFVNKLILSLLLFKFKTDKMTISHNLSLIQLV